jgi:ATP-binding cassette subfamily C protein
MQKLDFFSALGVLGRADRTRLLIMSMFRILANLLDILGLAGIALLASVFSNFAGQPALSSTLTLPGLGTWVITETAAVVIASAVALVFLIKSAFSIWLNYLTAMKIAKIESNTAKSLADYFFEHEAKSDGGSLSKFQNQVIQSSSGFGTFLNGRYLVIAEASLMIAIIGVFLIINPIAALGLFAFLGLVFWLINRFTTRRIVSASSDQQAGYLVSLETTKDLFAVKRESQLAGVSDVWLSKFGQARTKAAIGSGNLFVINGLPRYLVETSLILGIFGFLGGVVIFSDIASQAVSIGVFMAGGLRLIASLIPLQAAWNQMINGGVIGQGAFEVLQKLKASPSNNKEAGPSNSKGPIQLRLEDLSFSYEGVTMVLDGISFTAEAGMQTALVGPSGAGKSTVFDLALGFLKATSGSISLNGDNPAELIGRNSGAVGLVPQSPRLISGTLAENVSLLPDKETDADWVASCLSKVGLDWMIGTDGLGIEAQLHPDAGQLSGGEIQRIGLARALYRRPKILFLDEATSALDAETESRVSKMLETLKGEVTLVTIAHRISTVMNADKIIYLQDGKIHGQGTFAELKKSVPSFMEAVRLMGISEETR